MSGELSRRKADKAIEEGFVQLNERMKKIYEQEREEDS